MSDKPRFYDVLVNGKWVNPVTLGLELSETRKLTAYVLQVNHWYEV